MVELADSLDSGSSVQYARAGSSPASRTKETVERLSLFLPSRYWPKRLKCLGFPTKSENQGIFVFIVAILFCLKRLRSVFAVGGELLQTKRSELQLLIKIQRAEAALQLSQQEGLGGVGQQMQTFVICPEGEQPFWVAVDDVAQGRQCTGGQGHRDALACLAAAGGAVDHALGQVELGVFRLFDAAHAAGIGQGSVTAHRHQPQFKGGLDPVSYTHLTLPTMAVV